MATMTATETRTLGGGGDMAGTATRNDPLSAPALANLGPGFPVAHPTISHWQEHARDSPWHDHVHSTELMSKQPDDVELTIVGSGISGCLAAYFYLKQRHEEGLPGDGARGRVLLLEARRACSGATGRNGGHCRPDSYAGFLAYSKLFSPSAAHDILCNERETFELMRDVVQEEGLAEECEWWQGRTWALFLDVERKARARKAFEAYRGAGHLTEGDGPGQVQWIEDETQAREMSRVQEAVGGATFEAGCLYPLKFCHAILRICAERYGLELYTHTPVTAIHRGRSDEATSARWTVATPRGTISTGKLLLATNGYTTALLPSMNSWLAPHRAQCSSVRPSANFHASSPGRLDRTYSLGRREGSDYEYLTQRPDTAGGYFILGGGHPFASKESQVDTWDDSEVMPTISKHLSSYCGRVFDDWKLDDGGVGAVEMIWTGIQGYSRDSVPTVGEVPASLLPGATDRRLGDEDPTTQRASGRTNLYICGSHHGHGMARAATCSRGIAREMAGEASLLSTEASDEDWAQLTGLPAVFRWTATRAQRRDVDCRYDF
ncbi:DAO-domain-containing protein [Jaminaea rosea]|uniref:DAO-domain-containing protein n=1 Tax=Jaminaea rosea TaxID=1569628 RepID=A0A316V0A3_9BASI|nr:DAO-domain-containing protein [Jaminaea rosea]PWN30980.1 DAO-domain-containing protein [Jaminaea rosea]